MTSLQKRSGIDYIKVNRYWSNAKPSVLGPYMMDGFGFPAGAGNFRFHAETAIVQDLIKGQDQDGTVLDMGCGIGCWTQYFAKSFHKVIAIESSEPLCNVTKELCAPLPNVKATNEDVMTFEPKDQYELVFLGGMLMYLNENDLIDLLRKVMPFLGSGGVVLCRETTVKEGVVKRHGEYQAIYRSVETYKKIFGKCGLSVIKVKKNSPYIIMQMGCELMKKWKAIVPAPLQFIPIAGHIVYLGVRLAGSLMIRVLEKFSISFPELENHFFLLRSNSYTQPDDGTSIADS